MGRVIKTNTPIGVMTALFALGEDQIQRIKKQKAEFEKKQKAEFEKDMKKFKEKFKKRNKKVLEIGKES